MNGEDIDHFDARILAALQEDAGLSQRELAERIGLSQNACWRRLQALGASGVIGRRTVKLDRDKVGLGLVVFTMVRTSHHSREWLEAFRGHVAAIPEITDFYRISGNYDYMLKIVTGGMAEFDAVYQRLITGVELSAVSSYFAMEAILEDRPLAIPVKRRR